MKKIFCIALAVCCLFCSAVFPCHAQNELSLSAKAAVLMDADSGMVLWSKNADTRMGMASTTKIMTALTVLRLTKPENTVVIPTDAVGIEGSSIYLCEGERLTVEQLLYALILSSANDAAAALAIYCSGSIEKFAAQMNAMADELGLIDTNFVNPHGLDDKDHYTTARELALITREALENDLLCKIFSTKKATIPFCGEDGGRLLVNHNKMLSYYDGAIGVKTGFTKRTGRSLVSAAKRDGMTLICVTLGAPDDWRDHTALLDFGFENFRRAVIADVGEYKVEYSITGADKDTLTLVNTKPLVLTLPRASTEIQYTVSSTCRFAFAPIKRGDTLAIISVSAYGQVANSPLIAAETITQSSETDSFWHKFLKFFKKD